MVEEGVDLGGEQDEADRRPERLDEVQRLAGAPQVARGDGEREREQRRAPT